MKASLTGKEYLNFCPLSPWQASGNTGSRGKSGGKLAKHKYSIT